MLGVVKQAGVDEVNAISGAGVDAAAVRVD
jgi:hypothetical protein